MRIIFILVIFILGCAKEKPIAKENKLDDWAGSPDNPQSNPFEYFYRKSTGRASEKAISLKNQTLMEKSCIDATKHIRDEMIYRLMQSSLSSPCEFLMCGNYYERESRIKFSNPLLVSCTGNVTLLPEIKELHTQLNKTLKIQFINCKPTSPLDVNNAGGEWRECECTVYTHIPGGRKSVWEQCIELEKKFYKKN